ncbi:MAG: PepSY domain-containing protein [Coprobacillus sp.]
MKRIKGLLLICLAMTMVACGNNNAKEEKAKITVEEAKDVALKHANLEMGEVKFTEEETEYNKYDFEFTSGNTRYEYEIDAVTGKILNYDHETMNQAPASTTSLTLQKAKEIALTDASLKETDVTFTQTKEELENNIKTYEIDFNSGDKIYEYEINDQGIIIGYHLKFKTNPTITKTITLDEAKTIALKHAKMENENTSFTKTKDDVDDGIKVYDIEFQTQDKKYEYEVSMDGMILSYEIK